MTLHTLAYTRDAAPCTTPVGRTTGAVVGVADAISGGGRVGVTPRFVNFFHVSMLSREFHEFY